MLKQIKFTETGIIRYHYSFNFLILIFNLPNLKISEELVNYCTNIINGWETFEIIKMRQQNVTIIIVTLFVDNIKSNYYSELHNFTTIYLVLYSKHVFLSIAPLFFSSDMISSQRDNSFLLLLSFKEI